MEYIYWLEENEEELTIAAAESGADRELGYDSERMLEDAYAEYLDKTLNNQEPSAGRVRMDNEGELILARIEEELDLWESFEYLTDREQVMNLVNAIRKIIAGEDG